MSKNNKTPDTFISIDAMPSAIVDSGGQGMALHYEYYDTPIGRMTLVATPYGLSHALFDEEAHGLARLRKDYPNAAPTKCTDPHHEAALRYFETPDAPPQLKLVLRGTPFQRAVWRALLTLAPGQTSSYGSLAAQIGKPSASRAVGGAVGKNPVTFFVPCHRVLASDGGIGGYYWGVDKKREILAWENEMG